VKLSIQGNQSTLSCSRSAQLGIRVGLVMAFLTVWLANPSVIPVALISSGLVAVTLPVGTASRNLRTSLAGFDFALATATTLCLLTEPSVPTLFPLVPATLEIWMIIKERRWLWAALATALSITSVRIALGIETGCIERHIIRLIIELAVTAITIAIGKMIVCDSVPAHEAPKPNVIDLTDATPLPSLSAREIEILRLMTQSMSYSEIAEKLYLSPSTIRVHAAAIYRKLGVHDRASAVLKAKVLFPDTSSD
jgi:DNA-binding CsgD family transcriptional regulator